MVDGKVYFRENDRMTRHSIYDRREPHQGIDPGSVTVSEKLIEYQTEDYPEEMIRTEQGKP